MYFELTTLCILMFRLSRQVSLQVVMKQLVRGAGGVFPKGWSTNPSHKVSCLGETSFCLVVVGVKRERKGSVKECV